MRTDWQSTRATLAEEQVVAWRRGRLLEAGFGPDLADALAAEFRVDLHAVLELVERGCPPVLAALLTIPSFPLPE
jgi:hypothetical protein